MMKFLSYATATSVALVALQGCKSESGPDAMYKAVNAASTTVTKTGFDAKKVSDTYTTFKKAADKINKMKKEDKPKGDDLKKYKITEMEGDLDKMNAVFCTVDKENASKNMKQYTDKIVERYAWYTAKTYKCDVEPPSPIEEALTARDNMVAQLNKAIANDAANKDTYQAQIDILAKFDKTADVEKVNAAVEVARKVLPQDQQDVLELAALKKQIPGLITQLGKFDTKHQAETKPLIDALNKAKDMEVKDLKEVRTAVKNAKKFIKKHTTPTKTDAELATEWHAKVITALGDDAKNKEFENSRWASLKSDKQVAEYKAQKDTENLKAYVMPLIVEFWHSTVVDAALTDAQKDDEKARWEGSSADEKLANYNDNKAKNEADLKTQIAKWIEDFNKVKAADADFTTDMTTYGDGAGKLSEEQVGALKNEWSDLSNDDKLARDTMMKSLKNGDEVEVKGVFAADETIAKAEGATKDATIRTNVLRVYKAIADKQLLKEAKAQHEADMTGDAAVGLSAEEVADEKFRFGKATEENKIAQMKVVTAMATPAEKKAEYIRLTGVAVAEYTTDFDTKIDVADVTLAITPDAVRLAKVWFAALKPLETMSTELEAFTAAATPADKKTFVDGKLVEAAVAQHTTDVADDSTTIVGAGADALKVNEKFRWTTDVNTDPLKLAEYLARNPAVALADVKAYYQGLVDAAILVQQNAFNGIRDTAADAVCAAADRPFANEYWASLKTLQAQHEFVAELQGKANDAERKQLLDGKLAPFKNVSERHAHFRDHVLVNAGDQAIEDERWAGIADKLAAFNTMVGDRENTNTDPVTDPLFQADFDTYKANVDAINAEFASIVGDFTQAQTGAADADAALNAVKTLFTEQYAAGALSVDQKWEMHFQVVAALADVDAKAAAVFAYNVFMQFSKIKNLPAAGPLLVVCADDQKQRISDLFIAIGAQPGRQQQCVDELQDIIAGNEVDPLHRAHDDHALAAVAETVAAVPADAAADALVIRNKLIAAFAAMFVDGPIA